jgi:hypothetical protein
MGWDVGEDVGFGSRSGSVGRIMQERVWDWEVEVEVQEE